MSKGRLEAFSDGVLAIVITIMVLELKAPHEASLGSLDSLLPEFLSYVLSFVMVGIYWNNHHHLLQAAEHIDGRVLWANLHLLFWLSLVPFVTAWMGKSSFAPWPVAAYGVVMLLSGCGYFLLTRVLIAHHGLESRLARAVGRDLKAAISVVTYAAAIPLSFLDPRIACALYIFVAIIWLIPDRRIEMVLAKRD